MLLTRQDPRLADVAIAHDFLNQRGGAERVVLEMASLFPDAPIHTSLYRAGSTFPDYGEHAIRTGPLHHLPVNRGFRALLPLYPTAFRAMPPIDAEVALISSSAFAHHIRSTPRTLRVVYCYTPARWLYGGAYLHAGSTRERLARPLYGRLRRLDQRAAARTDQFIAISSIVARRIRETYGVDAPVVAPPVGLDRFTPTPRGERLLVVSRLLPYKRVDLVVEAATQLGLPLDVVGTGPDLPRLRALAGPTVAFHGGVDDAQVTAMMQACRTFFLPGLEDFGITPVEAQAAGKPVVAFSGGGALDTVADGRTGVFFTEHTAEAVVDAIRRAEEIDTAPEVIARNAERFSVQAFRDGLLGVISDALERRR